MNLCLLVIPWCFTATEVCLFLWRVYRRGLLDFANPLLVIHDAFLDYSHLICGIIYTVKNTVKLRLCTEQGRQVRNDIDIVLQQEDDNTGRAVVAHYLSMEGIAYLRGYLERKLT